MTDLKLIAFDTDDLDVLSAHLQDGVLKVAEMAYLKRERRFAVLINRFDWSGAHDLAARSGAASGRKPFQRRRSALRFERVTAARTQGIDRTKSNAVLALLAIRFERRGEDDPAGIVTLLFAGGGAVQLDVECIEAELRDLGAAWATKAKPAHPTGE